MILLEQSLFIGIATTLLFDLWGRLVARLRGTPPPAWKLPGRWFAHLARGRLCHADISAAAPVWGESAIGWLGHYLTGIVFAAGLLIWRGPAWAAAPTLGPAMVVGVGTVLLGWLVMSPCMGNGIAASRAPNPWSARGLGLAAHVVFGLGLWLSALVLAALG